MVVFVPNLYICMKQIGISHAPETETQTQTLRCEPAKIGLLVAQSTHMNSVDNKDKLYPVTSIFNRMFMEMVTDNQNKISVGFVSMSKSLI